MTDDRRQITSVIIWLISSILACMELNVALLNAKISYARRRLDIFKLFCSLSTGQNVRQKQLKRAGKQHRPRRFWVRPGRTSAWWDNFVNQIVIAEEWRENFRMSRGSLYELANELRPYIEGKTTVMRAPVDVVKQVAVTLYYLSDEGRIRKTANAFGLSRQVVSNIIRKVCKAITFHLGPRYIKLPFTESEVKCLVKNFNRAHGFPQCIGAIDGTYI